MIRSLRQRHRHMFAVLGVALPVALIVGLAARRPVPAVASLPNGIFGEPRRFIASQFSRDDLFTKTPVHVALVHDHTEPGRLVFRLSASKDFVKPDLLVYWVAGNASVSDTIPDNAILLGSFESPAVPLPRDASHSNGTLILYSLADHEIVDVSKPFAF